MLTKQKLTTAVGYVKYRTQAEAERVARKLDLQGTHSHQMNGMTIYMPSNSHSALNAELRKRGLPETMVPVNGASMGMESSDRMEMGMTGSGGMMPDPSAESMPGGLESDDMMNMDRMTDAGMSPEDEMSLDDGMFDLEMGPDEEMTDPMGMDRGEMGMDQTLFGEIEMTGDEDDDGDMEIY
jgi:hypothetical protein